MQRLDFWCSVLTVKLADHMGLENGEHILSVIRKSLYGWTTRCCSGIIG